MKRFDNNPLLTPDDVEPTSPELRVLCTLNPAAVRHDGETLLLVRVGEAPPPEPDCVCYLYFDADTGEVCVGRFSRDDPDLSQPDARLWHYRGKMVLTSMSHLRIARSRDGRTFRFDPHPAIFPATPYEAYGCEDARITRLEGRYWITYTAVSSRGVAVALASTEDFRTFERHGLILPPYNKDVCLFPEKVGGRYVCRHRPFKSEFNDACIWTAYSPDLLSWGSHEMTLAPRPDTWEGERVGCGGPPIRTEQGWLDLHHAADPAGRYCLGAMLTDLEEPHRLIARSSRPVLEPEADYELKGVFHNVVFSNGMIVEDDGTLTVFYGAADRICAGAVTTVDEMVAAAKE